MLVLLSVMLSGLKRLATRCSRHLCHIGLIGRIGLMGLNGIKDFKDPGSFDIFRLATAADRQAVGIYRSSLLLRCRIELCALRAHPTHPARSSAPHSLIGMVLDPLG